MVSTFQDRQAGGAGLGWKSPVRAASTANLTLSATQTVDGVALVDGDRVLVKDQTTGLQNGIYIVRAGAWDRAPDWDGTGDVVTGTLVFVIPGGSTNAKRVYYVSTTGTIVVGTTSVAFTLGTTLS
jgi:phage-related tail fiber protein